MDLETKSDRKIRSNSEKKDPDSMCELGIRHLGGLFGIAKDPEAARNLLTAAAESGCAKAEAVIGNAESASGMMENLAAWYENRALDLEQIPSEREEYSLMKKFAVFWYRLSMEEGNEDSLYRLAKFYYYCGGPDYELSAVLLKYYWEIEGKESGPAVEILEKMMSNGWIKTGWNCYYDVLCFLREYGTIDVTDFELNYDENQPVDDVTADSFFEKPPEYPVSAEEDSARTKRRLVHALFDRGIPARERTDGSCSVKISDCPDLADKISGCGYEIRESRGFYIVRIPKSR